MKKVSLIFLSFFFSCSSQVPKQDIPPKIKTRITSLKKQLIEQQKLGNHLLSPQLFKEIEYQISIAYKGYNADDVIKRLSRVEKVYQGYLHNIKLAEKLLDEIIDARQNAIKLGARHTRDFKLVDIELLILGTLLEENKIHEVLELKNKVLSYYLEAVKRSKNKEKLFI